MLHHNGLHGANIEKNKNHTFSFPITLTLVLKYKEEKNKTIQIVFRTMLRAFSVVSSRDAAKHPSSVDPPSHIPANAAMLLDNQKDTCS